MWSYSQEKGRHDYANSLGLLAYVGDDTRCWVGPSEMSGVMFGAPTIEEGKARVEQEVLIRGRCAADAQKAQTLFEFSYAQAVTWLRGLSADELASFRALTP